MELEPGFYWVVYGASGRNKPEIARFDIDDGNGGHWPRWTFMDDVASVEIDSDFGATIKTVSDRLTSPVQKST